MKRPKHCEKAFTLVELMVALVIFAFAITALVMTLASISSHNTKMAQRSRAMISLENLMEENTAYVRMRFPDGTTGFSRMWQLGVNGVVAADSVEGIAREIRITSLNGSIISGSARITFTGTARWGRGPNQQSMQASSEVTSHD